jgi:hypothetical protein
MLKTALLAAALVALAGSPPAQAEQAKVGQWGIVKPGDPQIACASLDDMERLVALNNSGDTSARDAFFAEHCQWIQPMTEVMVEDFSFWTGKQCVRPRGDATCVWVAATIVEERPN